MLRDVFRAYLRHWRLLVPLSVVVLLPQAAADAAFGDIEIDGVHDLGDLVKLLSFPLAVAINLSGEALFAGILAATVVEWRAGRERAGVREIVPTIPIGRLIAIDLILALGTAMGITLLIVPGVVFYTYLVISPTFVEIEHRSIRAALRRSIELVQGNFWRVLGVSVLFLVATDAVGTALEAPFHALPLATAFNIGIEAVLEPFQGLATVMTALALIEVHDES